MSALPAGRFLAEFGAAETVIGNARMPAEDEAEAHRSAVEEAYARGLQEAAAAAGAECEDRLAEAARSFEERLVAQRAQWTAEEGERTAAGLRAGLAELEARIADAVARVLRPFVAGRLREQAIAELGASLEVLLSKDPGLAFSICGPQDLLDAVRLHLGGKDVAATYQASGSCDVRVVIGQTVLETQLGAWMRKLEGASA